MNGEVINALLVEGDLSSCRFVKQTLSDCSKTVKFHTETAKDLAAAIQILNCKPFDIILLDLQLPDSSGINTVKRIRASNPHIPIIVITELADEEIGVQAIKNGADDYLVKGKIFKDVLGRSIRYAIERRKEHARAEKVLKDERNRAQNYLDVAGVILLVIDNERKISLVNKKGCEILGYSEKDIVGKDWCDIFVPAKARSKVESVISTLLKGRLGTFEYFENPVLTKSGAERLVAWHNTVLCDENGKVEAVLSSGEDITERKQAEEQKTRLLEEIENTNQELKDFAHVVSHDLKVPLRGIKLLADGLAASCAGTLSEDGERQIDLLLKRVDRMHGLIDGILQYSRIGRTHEEQTWVNLNELVSETIETIGPPENVKIKVEDELPMILCERTRITQVFQNLLSNAVKYMDKPKGYIKVGCVEENGFWKFSVADNGPGIEEKYFEKIFKIFQMLSTSDETESTGIGLSVVKKIVEMYDGNVWVEAKPGYGSTFFFTLPRTHDAAKRQKQLLKSCC
jgi:PAS domain S-box-containing protein